MMLSEQITVCFQVLNIGNGLALLGITTVICEFVLMYFIKVCVHHPNFLFLIILTLLFLYLLSSPGKQIGGYEKV